MPGIGDSVGYAERRALCDRIFAPLHPGGIFVAAFRSLVEDPYAEVIRLDGWRMHGGAPGETELPPLREADPYRDALHEFLLHLIPAPPGLASATGLLVSDQGLSAARDAFRSNLGRANSAYAVAAVVLALMDAIEQKLASALISEFRSRHSAHSPRCSPVDPAQILPKPPMALGTDLVEPFRPLPPAGQTDQEVLLADAFGRLTATPHESGFAPSPALHVHAGSGRASREQTTWRVAMLSILADVDDVDWQAAGGVFRGTRLRNSRVRARLEWALEKCDELAPDVIVIPELNVDEDLAEVLRRWMESEPRGRDAVSPLMVYGALHTPSPAGAVGYRNRPVLLTPAREIEWDYWKVVPVYNSRDHTYENLAGRPSHVVAIDLPAGRVGVLVCKDFLTTAVRRSMEQLRPTLMIVPAMTSPGSVERFRVHALDYAAALRCVTVFCNSSVLLRQELAASTAQAREGTEQTDPAFPHGGTLGVVQVNTRMRNAPASHPLRLTPSTAVLAVYTISTDEKKALEVACEEARLTPDEEEARVR